MATDRAGRFGSVQVLRAIAANMVVVSHLADVEVKFQPNYAILPQCPQLGSAGVHIFFVISGFVMAVVAAKQPPWIGFIYNRVTRIYPIYWFYTSILVTAYFAFPRALADRSDVSVIASYLLWPMSEKPLLIVGWTLIHEMYFYAVIAFMLLVRIPLLAGLLVWAAIISLPVPNSVPLLAVVFSPLTFDFIAGALFGLCVRKRKLPSVPSIQMLERMGDASYSVYLGHVLFMSAMARVFEALPWHGYIGESVFIAVSIAAVNVAGLLSYRYIERPMLHAARLVFEKQQVVRPLS